MTAPGELAPATEHQHGPPGRADEDSFAGYGVMGLPFRSGHVLAMRRFPASSIGPAYTSVWHRDPAGAWTFWQDQPDDHACPHYFSRALSRSEQTPVEIEWPDADTLHVRVPAAGLDWTSTMAATPVTRAMNTMGAALPERAWRSKAVLQVMSRVAGAALRAGRVGLMGTVPNGQHFIANPLKIWVITKTTARIGEVDLGPQGPLGTQARLGDFWIPQRGVFVIGRAYFTPPGRD